MKEVTTNKQTSFPRKFVPSIPKNVQLHLFSDTSLETLCCVAYFLAEIEDDINVSFVLGKCRINPLKQLSFLRLELQAVSYSVRLRKVIIQEHDMSVNSGTHWTDSVSILQLLNSADKKQNVFFANRAVEILENCTIDEWKHFQNNLNSSDIGTRGITIEKLSELERLIKYNENRIYQLLESSPKHFRAGLEAHCMDVLSSWCATFTGVWEIC